MRRSLLILLLALAATTAAAPRPATAVRVADISRPAGARTNVLTGLGLVVGLKGTGDGGAYLPSIKPLAQLLGRFGDAASVADLSNANNVAIVMVTATTPKDGVRNGDHLDVHAMSVGAATSLRGGTLYMAPLLGPTGKPYVPHDATGAPLSPVPYALANGPLELDDASVPTSGTVKGGAVMEADLPAHYVNKAGVFSLVIDNPSASWAMASTIARLINEQADQHDPDGTPVVVAVAADPKNVQVLIPAAERDRPDVFIANVLRLQLPAVTAEARVRINGRTGIMVATADAEISPTVVSYKGLTISIGTPQVPGRPPQRGAVTPDPSAGDGWARPQDLAVAFDQLKVPIDDRIAIVKQLYDNGDLHAKLVIDGEEK